MTAARGPGGAFAAALLFEARKFSRGRLWPFALLAIVGATVIAGAQKSGASPAIPGWQMLAGILEMSLPLATFFLVIIGTVAVNEEISSKAMRAVLLRPVARRDVICAKAAVLLLLALLFAATAWGAAVFWVRSHGGFAPVTLEIEGLDPVTKFDVATMTGYTKSVFMATTSSILAAPLFGLLISTLVESQGTSVALALFLWFGMRAPLGIESLTKFFFPTYLDRPLELLAEVAAGVETNVPAIEAYAGANQAIFCPLGLGAAFLAVALGVFLSRETRC